MWKLYGITTKPKFGRKISNLSVKSMDVYESLSPEVLKTKAVLHEISFTKKYYSDAFSILHIVYSKCIIEFLYNRKRICLVLSRFMIVYSMCIE